MQQGLVFPTDAIKRNQDLFEMNYWVFLFTWKHSVWGIFSEIFFSPRSEDSASKHLSV